MVVFVCGSCGESVKKAAVDKHCQTKCRNCYSLSCIDCGKDFPGETFRSHNQCMTEQEKWHGADFKPKTGGNSGQKKQDAWAESLQNAIPAAQTSNPQLADVLQKILAYENVPRKEAKFKNFLKNSLRIYNHQIVTAVWNIVGSVKATPTVPSVLSVPSVPSVLSVPPVTSEGTVSSIQRGTLPSLEEVETAEPAKKKSKTAPADDALLESNDVTDGFLNETPTKKFRWKKEIRDVLVQSDSQTLSEKKLKKKVLRRYETWTDLRETVQDDLHETFEKYLRKYPDLFHVSEDKVVKLINA